MAACDAAHADASLVTLGEALAMQPLAPVRHKRAEDGVQLFSFVQDLAEPIKNVLVTAYASRGKLIQDIKCHLYIYTNAATSMPGRATKVLSNSKIHALLAEEEDPEALSAVVVGLSSALCIGSGGALVGTAMGCPLGTLLGAVPALLTFGLSLPIGAVCGAGFGFCTGGAIGTAAGLVGGAASGYGTALYRVEIRSCYVYVATKLHVTYDVVVARPAARTRALTREVKRKAKSSKQFAATTAWAAGRGARSIAESPATYCAAAGAATGAAALGAVGAATGAACGCVAGAAVGVVPALFTFGLSIPFGAAMGTGAGFLTGATVGSATGGVTGGALGYAGYRYRGLPAELASRARGAIFRTAVRAA